MKIHANIPSPSGLEPSLIEIEDGMIKSISASDGECQLTALPGFIDIHTHGGAMIDVNHVKGWQDIEALSLFYASHGVTSVLLSVMTDTADKMESLVQTLGTALEKPTSGAQVVGIHLEGPFLSQEYKGAMPSDLIRSADWDFLESLIHLSHDRVRYITLAPEADGMMDLIRRLRARHPGIVISMGHSAAEYETAIEAVDAGVRSATHLFNAMKLFHMHRPAISGAALERDEVYAEVIADGFHLHPATVRLILKTKGWDRVVCISDSIMATGLPPGTYKLGVNDVIVAADGDAKLPDGVRAGSTLTLDRAYRKIREFTGADDWKIQRVLSSNAADLLHLDDRGRLVPGKKADIALLDKDGFLAGTIVNGHHVYKKQEE